MLQRRNDKIVPRLGISFDAKTLVIHTIAMRWILLMKKKVVAKKKRKRIDTYWHSSSLDQSKWVTQKQVRTWKKTLLLFLSTTAFSNWRGKPSSAKHKLHPNGFCLYLLNSTKEKSNEISTNVVSFVYYVYIHILYSLNKSFTFYKWGEVEIVILGRREWPGASACFKPALQNGVIVSYENK